MRFDIISDVHLTHFRDHGKDWIASWIPEGETLIMAGDIGEFHWWQLGFQKIHDLCKKYQHVLFVPGNHEYYGTTLDEGDARFHEIESRLSNFHFLEQDIIEIDGMRIAGCSLWFKDSPTNQAYERYMNDFRLIQQFKPAVYERNQKSQAFLRGLENIDIVITHHLPSSLSVHAKYENDPLNLYFLCEMDDAILKLQPKFFIHGHTHIACEYKIGETQIVCNPMGYPRENDYGPEGYKPRTIEL